MSDAEIANAIAQHEGDGLPGFPSPDTFEFLVLPHLRKIQEPALECAPRSDRFVGSSSETTRSDNVT